MQLCLGAHCYDLYTLLCIGATCHDLFNFLFSSCGSFLKDVGLIFPPSHNNLCFTLSMYVFEYASGNRSLWDRQRR